MYTIQSACQIVREIHSTEDCKEVFTTVLQNSAAIRYSHKIYQCVPASMKALLIVLYGLKCYLALARVGPYGQQVAFFAPFPNEQQVLNHVRNKLTELKHSEFTISLHHCFGLKSVGALVAFAPAFLRLYRHASKLTKRHDFLPACRIFTTITYYMRFKRLLADSGVHAVFIASQYSSECMGLAAAAHCSGKKVLFANHSNAVSDTTRQVPLNADLVAVTNQAVGDAYQQQSAHKLNIVPFPIATTQAPMQLPELQSRGLIVGVFLTGLTNKTHLLQLLDDLLDKPSIGSVFVRAHPVQLVNCDLSDVGNDDPRLVVSNQSSLGEDIERADFAVCGNSTVTIEILRGGKPVVYDHQLDHYGVDHHRFASSGLVMAIEENVAKDLMMRIRDHYLNSEWPKIMRYFDSSYQLDETEIVSRFNEAVENLVKRP